MTLGKWVKKARESGRVPYSDLSEPERPELERLRKENATLRMERDFAKEVAAWFAKEQPGGMRRSRTGRPRARLRARSCGPRSARRGRSATAGLPPGP